MRQRLLQHAGEPVRLGHAPGLHAECFGNPGVVGRAEVDRKIAFVIAGFLPRLDPAVDRVRNHDQGYRQSQANERLQFARAHAEAAVAHDRHRLDRRPRQMGPHRRGHGIAERAVRTVREIAPAGAAHRVVSREIGARRAWIRDHDGVGVELFREFRHHALGFDRHGGGLRQDAEFRQLRRARLRHRRGLQRPRERPEGFAERCERKLRIPHQRHVDAVADAEHRRIDIEMNHLDTARRGMPPALGGDRTGAAANEYDEIGGIDDRARLGRAAIGAHHADRERMIFGNRTLAADGGRHRCRKTLGEFDQLVLGTRQHDAAAADEDRPPRAAQQLCRQFDVKRIRRDAPRRVFSQRRIGPDLAFFDRPILHVERQCDMRRARAPGGHRLESGAERARHVGRAIEHRVPFGQRAHQRALIQLGEREAPARRKRNVGVDREHRDRRFVRLHQPRQDIGRAAAARSFADADLARDARVAVGHVGRVALVARQHVPHAVLQACERVVERQARVAAQAEDYFDAMRGQHPDRGLGAGNGLYPGCNGLVHGH